MWRDCLYLAVKPGSSRKNRAGADCATCVCELSIEVSNARAQGYCLLRQYAPFFSVMIVLLSPAICAGAAARAIDIDAFPAATGRQSQGGSAGQESANTPGSRISAYEGKQVTSIELPGVPERDRAHLLQLLPQKSGEALGRELVRESIRVLYSTGRFADIQAEVTPAGNGVVLTFVTSPDLFVGAIDVEGAPSHPNANQIINATKFELGELYTLDKLDRALQNIRLLMQENGYYRARVTAESTAVGVTQQVDLLFHITPGQPANVGQVQVTGTSGVSVAEVQRIAHMDHGDRVTASRISDSLQRLRKKFQKQKRVLAQFSIAQQQYRPETNTVDYTFKIDPGPVVVIMAQGFRISRRVLRKEIPVRS